MDVALIVCIGWILSVCLHEFGHAVVAYWGGDTSVKDKGYLTFNIFKYTDVSMTLIFPVLILMLGGIGLPGAAVYIDHRRLRGRAWQSAVSLAGPVMTALCAFVFALPFRFHWFPASVPDDVWYGLAFLIEVEAIALVLNSLPVPPFDGYGFIEPWLPMFLRARIAAVSGAAMWVVFLALWTVPGLNHLLWTAAHAITSWLQVSPRMADIGQATFQKNSGWLMVFIIGFLFLMKRAEKKAPQTVASPDSEAEQYYRQAKQLLAQNQPVDAVDALNKAVSVKQDFAKAWQLRGVCFGLMNRTDEALQNFDYAIKLDPLLADSWYNRACLYALRGNYDLSLGDLAQAVKLNPDSIKPYAKQDPSFVPLHNDARFALLTN